MADDQQQTAAPDDQTQALIQQMLRQTLTGQAAQPAEPPHSGDNRTWGSLLGQALVGGAGPGSTDAANEQAGLRALQSIGLGMMAGSDYSQARHSLGSIVAGAIGGAQESNAAQNAAQLEYQKTQQEMQLARVKEAVPLLTLMQTQQQLANARNIALGNKPTGANTNIGAAGGGTYEGAIAGREGTGANPNSTALGTGQFLASTWQDFAKANPELFQGMTPDQVLAARTDPVLGTKAITWLAQQNADALTKAGVTPSGTSLGVAHYLGAGAAAKVMQAADNAPVSGFVSAAVVKANPELATMTAGQLRQRYANTPAPSFLGGPKPGAAPAPAVTAQTPPAASTGAPGVAQGDVAHPELAPGPPGSTGGAPTSLGAAVGAIDAGKPQYTVAPPPSGKGTPLPAGKLLSQNVDAEGQIIADTRTPQEIRLGGVQVAGPGAGPSLPPSPVAAPVATPEPGWGAGAATGYNVTPTGAAAAAPPPPPSTQVQPQAQPTAAQPDAFPPFTYQRGPLPATIQSRIDNPAASVSPDLTTALQVAAASGDIAKMAAAKAALGAAADAVRTKAIEEGEAYHTNERNKAQELYQKQFDAQQAIRVKEEEGRQTRLSGVQTAGLERDNKRLEALDTEAGASRNSINDLAMMRALSNSVGSVSGWSQIEVAGRKLGDWATKFNIGSPEYLAQIGNQQAYEAVANKIIGGLRAGVSMGSLSDKDLDFIKSQAPSLLQRPETRGNIIGFLEQVYQRKLDYAQTVAKYYEPGKTSVAKAEAMADKELGPLLKTLPTYSNLAGDAQRKARDLWIYQKVTPGTFFKDSSGRLRPYNPPPGWQPEGDQ